jgi:hypothetical protein
MPPYTSGKKISYKACYPRELPRGHPRLSFCIPMSAIALPLPHISLDKLYSLLEPCTVDRSSSAAVFQNWARTFTCAPSSVFRPESEHQLELILELARRERQTVRAVGIGHSPSDLACTSGYMIHMNRLNKIIEVRYRRRSLTFWSIFIAPILIPFCPWKPAILFFFFFPATDYFQARIS